MTTPAPTFRDFASQIFAGDLAAAASTLTVLLGLPEDEARAAAAYFQGKTADPAFLPLAMSLRTAVEGPDDGAIAALLGTCFGLDDAAAKKAVSALRGRYSASQLGDKEQETGNRRRAMGLTFPSRTPTGPRRHRCLPCPTCPARRRWARA